MATCDTQQHGQDRKPFVWLQNINIHVRPNKLKIHFLEHQKLQDYLLDCK